ncbi:AAA family ATPase [Halothiobacillus sp.]|uniref:ParA family protein n=1 Tax=Halothiobacillus sp. TaxID=1891311 RepID=UPI002631C66D|nr:AAA family ATPase [Halothiobacillus sp.]MDD4966168.1 AAA family ATPase [Halothiobacillus sp.]
MSWTLAITNQKGGVGKTTTAVNLAAALQSIGRRVLMIDLDPQGNATVSAGQDKSGLALTMADVLLDEASISDVIIRSEPAGFDLLSANIELAGAEFQLVSRIGREMKLRRALAPLLTNYDFVLIDCPPALNTLTINALVASDDVLIPVQCEYFALEGLSSLLETIEQVRMALQPALGVAGVLRTLYDARNLLAQQVSEQLQAHFGDQLFRTLIPRNVRLAEAPSHGLPALYYDRGSAGAQAYTDLAHELVERAEQRAGQ